MGWIPTNRDFLQEANNYENLSFFKKTKNILVTFIVVITAMSFFLLGTIEEAVGSGAIYELGFNLFLAIFIYFNHRWAMVVFALLYVASKVIFILSAVGTPLSHIIFGAVAVTAAYGSVRVATELKRKAKTT